jgi:flagellar hook-associated protein 1 FlgK
VTPATWRGIDRRCADSQRRRRWTANTVEDFYADLVGDVGFDTVRSGPTRVNAQNQLLDQMQAERDSVSGVNIDEEMVNMLQFQQSYEAAARFISVAQQMTDTLINLGR